MPACGIILVADDSHEDTFILRRAFIKAGITVQMVIVGDGQEAINYLSGEEGFADRDSHPLPRLLLLDLKMPKLDGFDVLRWLQTQPELKRLLVTVFTSSDESRDVNRAYDLGANSYLVKPKTLTGFVSLAEKLHAYWIDLNLAPDCAPKLRA